MYTLEQLQQKTFGELKAIGGELNVLPEGDRRYRESWINAIAGVNPPLLQLLEVPPGVEVDLVQEAIAEAAENPLDDAPNCCECFDDRYIEDEFGRVTVCRCNKEPKLSRQNAQRAIVPATSDLNPILTGISLSDKFLALYSPPQSETLHYEITDDYKVDADGQLSLFAPQVVTEPEPPDPDDFESLDAFREAIGLWDAQNPEALAVSMDSMCEWAPCPKEWYEPEAESLPLKASSMMELSPLAIECSITSANFTIPTFDAWCDRTNRQTDTDEPPDTGIFARLPGFKPPKFPPRAIGSPPNRSPNTAS